MTIGGWIFMLSSVAFVVGLCIWCFRKVLTTREGAEAGATRGADPE